MFALPFATLFTSIYSENNINKEIISGSCAPIFHHSVLKESNTLELPKVSVFYQIHVDIIQGFAVFQ